MPKSTERCEEARMLKVVLIVVAVVVAAWLLNDVIQLAIAYQRKRIELLRSAKEGKSRKRDDA